MSTGNLMLIAKARQDELIREAQMARLSRRSRSHREQVSLAKRLRSILTAVK